MLNIIADLTPVFHTIPLSLPDRSLTNNRDVCILSADARKYPERPERPFMRKYFTKRDPSTIMSCWRALTQHSEEETDDARF